MDPPDELLGAPAHAPQVAHGHGHHARLHAAVGRGGRFAAAAGREAPPVGPPVEQGEGGPAVAAAPPAGRGRGQQGRGGVALLVVVPRLQRRRGGHLRHLGVQGVVVVVVVSPGVSPRRRLRRGLREAPLEAEGRRQHLAELLPCKEREKKNLALTGPPPSWRLGLVSPFGEKEGSLFEGRDLHTVL